MKKRETPDDKAWIREFREKYPEEVRMEAMLEELKEVRPITKRSAELLGYRGGPVEEETGIVRAGKSWEDAELIAEAEKPHPYIDANSGVEDFGEPDSRNLRDYRDFEQQRNWEDEMAGRIRKSVPKVKEETMSDRKNHEIEEKEDEESRVEETAKVFAVEDTKRAGNCATGDHEPADSPIPYKTVKMCAKCRCIYVPKR